MKRKRLIKLAALITSINMVLGLFPGLIRADVTDDDAYAVTPAADEIISESEDEADPIIPDIPESPEEDEAPAPADADVTDSDDEVSDAVAEAPSEDDADPIVPEEPAAVEDAAEPQEAAVPAEEPSDEQQDVVPAAADTDEDEDVFYEVEEEVVSVPADNAVVTYPVEIDAEHFPDATFRTYVQGIVGGTTLTQDAAEAVTEITCDRITDLTGIEYFTKLESLRSEDGGILSVDLSNLTELISLDLQYNSLLELDISNNTKLVTINVKHNQIQNDFIMTGDRYTAIGVAVDISENQIKKIDVTGMNMTGLIFSKNPDLNTLIIKNASGGAFTAVCLAERNAHDS